MTDESKAQYFSFVFGSDDPRAKGRMSGDIVAGILVYGDVRDVVVGAIKSDELKLALGSLGIALTFVGPGADGPYSAMKSGAKLIASIPRVGYDLACGLVRTTGDVMWRRVAAGSESGALNVLVVMGKRTVDAKNLAGAGKADVLAGVDATRRVLSSEAFVATKSSTESLGELGFRFSRMRDGAKTGEDLMRETFHPAAGKGLLPNAPPETIVDELAQANSDVIGSIAAYPYRADAADELVEGFAKLRGAPDGMRLKEWWLANKNKFKQPNPGWYGWVFELSNNAKLHRQELQIPREGGPVRPLLVSAGVDMTGPISGVAAKVDHVAALTTGPRFIIDSKSGYAGSTASTRDQMERQAQVQAEMHLAQPEAWGNEIVWLFEGQPTSGLIDHARAVQAETGVRVRLVDENGVGYT